MFDYRPRLWPTTCHCRKCSDIFTVNFHIRKGARDLYYAELEKSTAAVISEDWQLIHRPGHCDGELQLMDVMPGRTMLVR